MTAARQDAWTPDDDLILAEVTLRQIREGGTQLAAFEEVGERIGRTAAACGFRWNSFVRKKYETAIQIAKAQRQKRNKQKKHGSEQHTSESDVLVATNQIDAAPYKSSDAVQDDAVSIEGIIRYLRQFKANYQEVTRQLKQYEKELKEKGEQLEELKKENAVLRSQVNEVKSDYQVVNEDYKALIQIMDRARKLALLAEDDDEHKPRFKMDANGNLERID
ncbi:RsfA family transcriptional regulator [Marinicrinis lubricantis]|uniref:RsfA family transcriptional regulator n=1 Tax=Marinicrinis lubricantis TaxID=2086470 RepID=A0ABW1IVD2_9BACL